MIHLRAKNLLEQTPNWSGSQVIFVLLPLEPYKGLETGKFHSIIFYFGKNALGTVCEIQCWEIWTKKGQIKSRNKTSLFQLALSSTLQENWRYRKNISCKDEHEKDRNCKGLPEAEENKKRWQKYNEEPYIKVLMTQITMMVWSLTKSQTSSSVKSSGP